MLQRRLLQGQSGLRLILYGHVRGGAGSNLADERVNNSIGFGGDYGFPERHNPLSKWRMCGIYIYIYICVCVRARARWVD